MKMMPLALALAFALLLTGCVDRDEPAARPNGNDQYQTDQDRNDSLDQNGPEDYQAGQDGMVDDLPSDQRPEEGGSLMEDLEEGAEDVADAVGDGARRAADSVLEGTENAARNARNSLN